MRYRLIKDAFLEAASKSGKKRAALSYAMTDGESEHYISNRLRSEHYQTLSREELEKLAGLIGADPDKIAAPEAEKNPAPAPVEVSEIAETIRAMARTLQQVATLMREIREMLADPEGKVPVTKRERAIELLRKELNSKNGGGVKVEDYKRLLVTAGIGSSYMQDAINELGCKKMFGNNGINYIVKEEFS